MYHICLNNTIRIIIGRICYNTYHGHVGIICTYNTNSIQYILKYHRFYLDYLGIIFKINRYMYFTQSIKYNILL